MVFSESCLSFLWRSKSLFFGRNGNVLGRRPRSPIRLQSADNIINIYYVGFSSEHFAEIVKPHLMRWVFSDDNVHVCLFVCRYCLYRK